MYNVYSCEDSIYMYDSIEKQYTFIGNERELIKFLVKGYNTYNNESKPYNKYFSYFTCNPNELLDSWTLEARYSFLEDSPKYFLFTRANGRIINPLLYKEKVYNLYELSKQEVKCVSYKVPLKYYHGEYRKDPISGTGRKRLKGYCSFRKPKFRRTILMYTDPEYRGAIKEKEKFFMTVWPDDFPRRTQRNWKSQRKTQYKTTKE